MVQIRFNLPETVYSMGALLVCRCVLLLYGFDWSAKSRYVRYAIYVSASCHLAG